MNKENLFKLRNEIQSKVVHRLGVKRNVINLNTHNSWQHELIKCRICFEIKKQGKHFITEAPMGSDRGRGICDILNLDDAQAIEIRVSETEDQLKHKIRKYPDYIEVVSVKDWESLFNGNYQVVKQKLI